MRLTLTRHEGESWGWVDYDPVTEATTFSDDAFEEHLRDRLITHPITGHRLFPEDGERYIAGVAAATGNTTYTSYRITYDEASEDTPVEVAPDYPAW